MDYQNFLKTFIEKTQDEARELAAFNGYKFRVTMKDGEHFLCTMDYRMDRVNVHVMDNKVTEDKLG